MNDFTNEELEVIINYLTLRSVEMEYTSVAEENKFAMKVLNEEITEIENYLDYRRYLDGKEKGE